MAVEIICLNNMVSTVNFNKSTLDNFIFTFDLHEQFSDRHSAYNKDRKEKPSSDQRYFVYNFQNLNKSDKNGEIVEKFERIVG